jgi:hypothetical protein
MYKSIKSRLGRIVAITGFLSAGVLSWGIAQAATGLNTGPTVRPAVPATAAGMPPTAQVMYAVVNANGTVARAFPSSITATSLGTGVYQVTTTQNISGCAFVGSTGQPGNSGTAPGQLSVAGRAGNVNAVFVETLSPTGAAANLPFHLAITC